MKGLMEIGRAKSSAGDKSRPGLSRALISAAGFPKLAPAGTRALKSSRYCPLWLAFDIEPASIGGWRWEWRELILSVLSLNQPGIQSLNSIMYIRFTYINIGDSHLME